LSEAYFYNLEKPGAFGVPNRILRNTGTELFKIRKTGGVPGKSGRMWQPRKCQPNVWLTFLPT